MGTLVAGVAHEINNPMTGIMAGLGTAISDVRQDLARIEAADGGNPGSSADRSRETLEALEDANEAALRVAQIVKDLAVFGAPSQGRARLRLADSVAAAVRWVPANVLHPADVTLEDLGAPDVKASRGQLEQVLVNLLTNAAKASRPGAKGAIRIRIGPGSAGTARLEVIDRGTGIDAATLGKIFDPFFTTRPTGEGRGTGLGLAVCHAIVTDHGGTLTVESEVGWGSTFRVELPAMPVEG
jgi:signal transduction histidine kinase